MSTKEKIKEVACELFADKGFDGTSVRDIAKAADVNVAAINYHFENKMGLYAEVFKSNHQWMADKVHEFSADTSLTISDFAWKMLEFFLDNGNALMNCFKMFLDNDGVQLSAEYCGDEEGNCGPPGQEVFLEFINREVEDSVPLSARHWAMRVIFSQIVHMGIVLNTTYMKKMRESNPLFTEESDEKTIREVVNSIMDRLKDNKGQWQ